RGARRKGALQGLTTPPHRPRCERGFEGYGFHADAYAGRGSGRRLARRTLSGTATAGPCARVRPRRAWRLHDVRRGRTAAARVRHPGRRVHGASPRRLRAGFGLRAPRGPVDATCAGEPDDRRTLALVRRDVLVEPEEVVRIPLPLQRLQPVELVRPVGGADSPLAFFVARHEVDVGGRLPVLQRRPEVARPLALFLEPFGV